MTINRQPQGIPIGGQFAATTHSEAAVQLAVPEQKSVTEHFLDRETILARRQRLNEQIVRMQQVQAAHSLRSVAATVLARFPGAVTLRVSKDPETGASYEPKSIANADGGLLELNMPEADYDDAWMSEAMVEDGPQIRDLVADLDFNDDSWTEGIGFIHGRGRGQRKTVDINLQAAVNAPDPFIAEEHDPRTRTLSLDEQTDLVEAANHGVVALEDIIEDTGSFDEHRQYEVMENLKDRVNTLLTVTKQAD
jgi:hypothetical protein